MKTLTAPSTLPQDPIPAVPFDPEFEAEEERLREERREREERAGGVITTGAVSGIRLADPNRPIVVTRR